MALKAKALGLTVVEEAKGERIKLADAGETLRERALILFPPARASVMARLPMPRRMTFALMTAWSRPARNPNGRSQKQPRVAPPASDRQWQSQPKRKQRTRYMAVI